MPELASNPLIAGISEIVGLGACPRNLVHAVGRRLHFG
jgi:hypothetical protein